MPAQAKASQSQRGGGGGGAGLVLVVRFAFCASSRDQVVCIVAGAAPDEPRRRRRRRGCHKEAKMGEKREQQQQQRHPDPDLADSGSAGARPDANRCARPFGPNAALHPFAPTLVGGARDQSAAAAAARQIQQLPVCAGPPPPPPPQKASVRTCKSDASTQQASMRPADLFGQAVGVSLREAAATADSTCSVSGPFRWRRYVEWPALIWPQSAQVGARKSRVAIKQNFHTMASFLKTCPLQTGARSHMEGAFECPIWRCQSEPLDEAIDSTLFA